MPTQLRISISVLTAGSLFFSAARAPADPTVPAPPAAVSPAQPAPTWQPAPPQPAWPPPAQGWQTSPAEREPATRWYGWQIVPFDATAAALLAGSIATFRLCLGEERCDNSTSGTLFLLAALGYGAGGPLVHGAHGRWGIAAASFGIRAAPTLAAPLMIENENSGAALFLGGVLAAMIVDAAVLAREPVPEGEARLSVLPSVDPRARSGSLLLTGRF